MADFRLVLRRVQSKDFERTLAGTPVDFPIPTNDQSINTYLVKQISGDLSFLPADGDVRPLDAVAVLKSENDQVLLQSFVEGCGIGTFNGGRESISLPRSIPNETHWIHLRLDDIIYFADQAFTFTVGSRSPNKHVAAESAATIGESVQVNSSPKIPPEPEISTLPGAVAEGEETDSELDAPISRRRSAVRPPKVLRDSSADPPNDNDEHESRPTSKDEKRVFSTAPETSSDGQGHALPECGEPTPTFKKPKMPLTYGKRRQYPDSIFNLDDDDDGLRERDDKPHESAKSSKSTSPQSSIALPEASFAPELGADGASEPQSEDEDIIVSSQPRVHPSSDVVDEHDAAAKAASRSVQRSKRKSTSQNDEEIAVAAKPKRSRLSNESHVSSATAKSDPASPDSAEPCSILLSSSRFSADRKTHKWLEAHGAAIVDDVPDRDTDFICVVRDGDLPTTAKLLRSLAMGKTVVTDSWVARSKLAGRLLPPDEFVHPDLLDDTSGLDRSRVFAGRTIFVTTALHDFYGAAWADVEALAREAGAHDVDYGGIRKWRARKKGGKGGAAAAGADGEENEEEEEKEEEEEEEGEKQNENEDGLLLIGRSDDDKAARQIVAEAGCPVYSKDLLTRSVLRGALLLDDATLRLDLRESPSTVEKAKRR